MKKKILGTSDAWSTSCLSHRPSKPVYYIVDCQISRVEWIYAEEKEKQQKIPPILAFG